MTAREGKVLKQVAKDSMDALHYCRQVETKKGESDELHTAIGAILHALDGLDEAGVNYDRPEECQ